MYLFLVNMLWILNYVGQLKLHPFETVFSRFHFTVFTVSISYRNGSYQQHFKVNLTPIFISLSTVPLEIRNGWSSFRKNRVSRDSSKCTRRKGPPETHPKAFIATCAPERINMLPGTKKMSLASKQTLSEPYSALTFLNYNTVLPHLIWTPLLPSTSVQVSVVERENHMHLWYLLPRIRVLSRCVLSRVSFKNGITVFMYIYSGTTELRWS